MTYGLITYGGPVLAMAGKMAGKHVYYIIGVGTYKAVQVSIPVNGVGIF